MVRYLRYFALLLALVSPSRAYDSSKWSYYPIILVPGLYNSPLEAKLEKPSVVLPECVNKTDDYVPLWAGSLESTICVADNLRVYYNSETHHIENSPGVLTRVVRFGSSLPLANLGGGLAGDYFSSLINEFINLGYVDDVSLRGAPYDFRKGLKDFDDFYANLKNLVEDTYRKNANTRVIFVAHDFGSNLVTLFLNQQSQEWKDKHVQSLVSLGAAFGGYVTPVLAYLQSIQKNLEFTEGVSFTRNFSAPYAQFPTPIAFNESYVIVQTPAKNYTLDNIEELFHDTNQPLVWKIYQDNHPQMSNINAPGVELHCLYGDGITTLTRISYKRNFFPYGEPDLVNELGDGQVPTFCLKACANFATKQTQPVHDVPFSGYQDSDIIRFGKPIEYIKKVVTIN